MIHRSWLVRSLRRQASRSLAAPAIAAALVAGCGGGEADSGPEPIDALSRYLPAGSPGYLAYADLAQAREQLGLPADSEALPFELYFDKGSDPDAPELQLLEVARLAMSPLGVSGDAFEPDPVTAALDDRAISAAATSAQKDGPLTAIQTSQPFDELADALATDGYTRDGSVLFKPGAEINEIADAGDGVILVSGRDASAADVAADPPGGPEAPLELLEPAEGSVALAIAGLEDNCVTGYGGWQAARGSSGVFRLAVVDSPAEAGRVQLAEFERYTDAELGAPTVAGNEVDVPFTGGDRGIPLRDFQSSLGLDLYDCD